MSEPSATYLREAWHLDKKVPIVLIFAILVQFVGLMMFVNDVSSQGKESARRIATLESQRVSERLTSLEAQMGDTKALLLRMESKIDRLADRVR